MSKKQITELESADSFDDGDLMLVRKTGAGVDRKLTKDKLVDSLGSSVISGYQASSAEANKIDLKAANKAVLKEYVEGMHICFIAPIATNGVAELKIDSLPYIKLEQYNSTDTAILVENEYVEAVYNNGAFKQTNKLNTNLVWSNEYTAIAEITGTTKKITKYKLTSAIGVTKPEYYNGMVTMFVVPEDSQGVVFISVDGLGDIPIGDGEVVFLNNNDFYKNRLMQLVYKDGYFLKYAVTAVEEPEDQPEYTNQELDEIAELPELTENDEPAAAVSPDSTNSRGDKFFESTIRVGNSEPYKNITAAINYLRNTFNDDGGGKNYAILLTDYVPPKIEIIGNNSHSYEGVLNLDWISIFSENNKTINLKAAYFRFDCNNCPILNAKFNVQIGTAETDYLTAGRSPFENYGPGKIILGKNFECILQANVTGFTGALRTYMFYNSGFYPTQTAIIAKHGYKLTTNLALGLAGFHSINLNNGDITLQQKSTPSTSNYRQSIHFQSDGEHYIANTVVHSTLTSEPVFTTYSPTILSNVTARDRNSNTEGIQVYSYTSKNSLTMEDCTFDLSTSDKKDVVINGTNDTRIYLKNTVVSTNQAIGTQTNKGLILNID